MIAAGSGAVSSQFSSDCGDIVCFSHHRKCKFKLGCGASETRCQGTQPAAAQGPGFLGWRSLRGKGEQHVVQGLRLPLRVLSAPVDVLRVACLLSSPRPPPSVPFSLVSVCMDFGPNHLLKPNSGRRGWLGPPGTLWTPSPQLPPRDLEFSDGGDRFISVHRRGAHTYRYLRVEQ